MRAPVRSLSLVVDPFCNCLTRSTLSTLSILLFNGRGDGGQSGPRGIENVTYSPFAHACRGVEKSLCPFHPRSLRAYIFLSIASNSFWLFLFLNMALLPSMNLTLQLKFYAFYELTYLFLFDIVIR